ncbi:hypothetical protein [Cesiribacter sp. SM1]|uniref:hypothetical protein n=1 Tax=Cesiribacter sp. SM1 TaxID=2861196 RepID=UPI001CD7EC4C|nr:hypothetical protein [Cesiribacter sp. SM1]
MKKTFLTFVALAFGMGVTFAQTAPQTEETAAATEQSITVDKMSNKPEEAGRRTLKVEELPAAVQQNLKGDEFKALKIVSITEVQPQEGSQAAAVQYEVAFAGDAAATEPTLVVFFDEKGNVASKNEAAATKQEE